MLFNSKHPGVWSVSLHRSLYCAGDVVCLTWDSAGRWLLSGSADQTTRLHARWDAPGGGPGGWRQLARPQVHGKAVQVDIILTLG